MAAPTGHKKHGGRKKGTPNKRNVYSVHERLKALGVDLVREILREVNAIEKPFLRAKCYLQLLEYCDAKRKAVELSTDDDEREKIRKLSDSELLKFIKENLTEDHK